MILEIRFLNGYYGADKDKKTEWPPTPARLYSALVNAAYTMLRRSGENKLDALRWLEKQTPPDIHYPRRLDRGSSPTIFVPLNDYSKSGSSFLYPNRQERRFPATHAKSPFLYFEWPGVDVHPDLPQIVRYLDQLGGSRSISVARFVDEIPEQSRYFVHLTPTEGDGQRMSCYHAGRLEMLDHAYENNSRIPDTEFVSYKHAEAVQPQPVGLYQKCDIFSLTGPYYLGSTHAALIADAIRGRLLHLAGAAALEPNALLAKTFDPHMAYFPLPFVGEYGTGVVMGVAIAIPDKIPESEYEHCKTILSKLDNFDYRGEKWTLTPVVESDTTPYTLRADTWAAPSTKWITVTPAEINWKVDPEKYIYDLCVKIGLPVKRVYAQADPFFGGIEQSRDYISRNRTRNGRIGGYLTHMMVEFERPVSGPLGIGNSANFGLGLLRPVREGQ